MFGTDILARVRTKSQEDCQMAPEDNLERDPPEGPQRPLEAHLILLRH